MGNEVPHPDGSNVGRSRQIGRRVLEEARRFLMLFFYLWVLLGLFVLNQTIVYRQQSLAVVFHGFAIVNALVSAKVMLVAEDLQLARWLKGRPMALTILFEAALCTVLLLGFHVIERVAISLYHGENAATGVPSFGGGGLPGLFIVSSILFVSLLPFFAFKNLTRVIGWQQMKEILFRHPKEFSDG
jgi:hypothetical protein